MWVDHASKPNWKSAVRYPTVMKNAVRRTRVAGTSDGRTQLFMHQYNCGYAEKMQRVEHLNTYAGWISLPLGPKSSRKGEELWKGSNAEVLSCRRNMNDGREFAKTCVTEVFGAAEVMQYMATTLRERVDDAHASP